MHIGKDKHAGLSNIKVLFTYAFALKLILQAKQALPRLIAKLKSLRRSAKSNY